MLKIKYTSLKNKLQLKGHSLIEVLASLSIIALVFVLGMGLAERFVGIYSPPERFVTRQLVQEFLQQEPPWQSVRETFWRRDRRIVYEVMMWDPEMGLFEIKVSAFWEGELVEKRSRFVRLESYRAPT